MEQTFDISHHPECRVCHDFSDPLRGQVEADLRRGRQSAEIYGDYAAFFPRVEGRPWEPWEIDYHSMHQDRLDVSGGLAVPGGAVDALEFICGSEFLNEDPFPSQCVFVKTFYGLWEEYAPDVEERSVLNILKNCWGIDIDLHRRDPVNTMVMVMGRRSGKSTILSLVATYELYKLICAGNPQRAYRLRERHPIYLTHVAAKADQAKAVFELTKNNIRRLPFFTDYIDFDKDSSSELRLFTPHDLELNRKIDARNELLPPGVRKESRLHGSLSVKSITTSAATNRGDAIILLMISELAHFERTEIDASNAEKQVISENRQTDYAVVKALSPSVRDFGDDARIIIESSPREKGGEFYEHYCLAGGMEQEDCAAVIPDKDYQLIQLSTWQANPNITEESLRSEFRRDPVGSSMEYGAHFTNPSASFLNPEWIDRAIDPTRGIVRTNPRGYKFVIAVDPGGMGKEDADTYAVAWGHFEGGPAESDTIYWIDGLHGWYARSRSLPGGRVETVPVDPIEVTGYVIDLAGDLGGRNYVVEIVYDQWSSAEAISKLQKSRLPARKTDFTNPYKTEMYGNYLEKLSKGQVRIYGDDVDGYVEQWKQEMLHLQRRVSGDTVYYKHPTSGPVRHDDYACVTANLVHRLCLRVSPTRESMAEARKHGIPVNWRGPRLRPIKVPKLWSGGRRW
jgi:hypothetical protein